MEVPGFIKKQKPACSLQTKSLTIVRPWLLRLLTCLRYKRLVKNYIVMGWGFP